MGKPERLWVQPHVCLMGGGLYTGGATDPGEFVSAAVFHGGNVCWTAELIQNDVGRLRVGHKVELPT